MKKRLKKKLYSDQTISMRVLQKEIFELNPQVKRRHGRIRKLLKQEHPDWFGRTEMEFTYKQLANIVKKHDFLD